MVPVSCKCKFEIGDRVTSKKTGLPMNGTVHRITSPFLFSKIVNVDTYFPWNELFLDWQEKPIYTVVFDEPQKHVTFEEFKFSNKKHSRIFEKDEERQLYNELPLQPAADYPEDDLELI